MEGYKKNRRFNMEKNTTIDEFFNKNKYTNSELINSYRKAYVTYQIWQLHRVTKYYVK